MGVELVGDDVDEDDEDDDTVDSLLMARFVADEVLNGLFACGNVGLSGVPTEYKLCLRAFSNALCMY